MPLREWARSDQALLIAFGTHAGLAALLLGWETYITDNGRFLFPQFWPPVFFAAWLATVIYHARRSSHGWWRASGALLFLAYLSRAATLILTARSDGEWTARFAFGASTWTLLAGTVELLWVRIVVPERPADACR